MNKIYLITGPPGVGKTTISYALGEKLEKSVVIEGDTIYNFFVGGRIKPWLPEAPKDLFWETCYMLIERYLKNGYDVVFNYIIQNKELENIKNRFKDYDITFKCLINDGETLLKRDSVRPEDCQMKERCLILLQEFLDCNFNEDEIIDESNLTIDEVASKFLENK